MLKQKESKARTDDAASARQDSPRLLATAKRAVEIAIEKGEVATRKSLEKETK